MMNVVDRLAEIRAEIRKLRREAREIRDQLLAGEAPMRGTKHVVRIERHLVLVPQPEERRPLFSWIGA